jgi:hypothetical protein
MIYVHNFPQASSKLAKAEKTKTYQAFIFQQLPLAYRGAPQLSAKAPREEPQTHHIGSEGDE